MFNLNNEWGRDDVKKLIASTDDKKTRQIVIHKNGDVKIHDGAMYRGEHHARLEPCGAGNNYLGKSASENMEWVSRIEKVLRDNWPKLQVSTYIEVF